MRTLAVSLIIGDSLVEIQKAQHGQSSIFQYLWVTKLSLLSFLPSCLKSRRQVSQQMSRSQVTSPNFCTSSVKSIAPV